MPTSDPNNFELIKWAWGILAAPILYLFKVISDHKQHVAESYVRHDSFTKLEERIFSKLDRIEAKLDDKADK